MEYMPPEELYIWKYKFELEDKIKEKGNKGNKAPLIPQNNTKGKSVF